MIMKRNEMKELIRLAKSLVKAIDDNSIETSIGEDKERIITQRFIADELEELRNFLKEMK